MSPEDLMLGVPTTPAPESSTWAMMLAGFAGLGFLTYRASRKPGWRRKPISSLLPLGKRWAEGPDEGLHGASSRFAPETPDLVP